MSRTFNIRSLAAGLILAVTPGLAAAEGPIPGGIKQGDVRVKLRTIATGLTAPVFGTNAPGDRKHLYVIDQPGTIWKINLRTGAKTVFADLTGNIVPLGVFGGESFDERGLIGIAFHPNYRSNGKLYTYTSESKDGGDADFTTLPAGDEDHHSVISEWVVPNPRSAGAVVDTASRRVLMRIAEPQFNHNSGALNFDRDGMLVVTVGDGGGADDQPDKDMQGFIAGPPFTPVTIIGHGETGNGQNIANVLGTILRIDPDARTSANGQYGIPEDNPFAVDGSHGGAAGCADDQCDEIFAYGFRNPFRASVDPKTGLIFLADVGQNDVEEVDIVVRGGNYGWNVKEGTFLFDHNGDDSTGPAFPSKNSPDVPPGMVDPVAQYDHDEGVAIIGGFVYRGNGVDGLRGRYVFGEFSNVVFDPTISQCNGRLFFLEEKFESRKETVAAVLSNAADGRMRELRIAGGGLDGKCVLGFGQDSAGEVYVLANTRGIPFGDTGEVLKITAGERGERRHDDDDD